LGLRAGELAGVGAEHARLVRLILLSYTRWPGRPGQAPWPSNATIAARARLTERQVERALAQLLAAKVITTRVGHRAGARRSVGRLIDVDLHEPCKALAPEAIDVASLWAVTKALRDRPAALVTAMVGAYMLASDAIGRPIDEWTELGCSMAAWRRFVGHADNASWRKRVRELEDLGLLRREGLTIIVSPPRAWFSLMVNAAEAERDRASAIAPVAQLRPAAPELEIVEREHKPDNGRNVAFERRPAAQRPAAQRPAAQRSAALRCATSCPLPSGSCPLPSGRLMRVEREWFDLREIDLEATGTGPPMDMLVGRGRGHP
jgi:hypothetical protein